MRLNIGCGPQYIDGFVNVDIRAIPCDIRADARNLPFKDGAFDEIIASDVIEHFTPEEVKYVLEELSRTLHGTILFRLPCLDSIFDRYREGERAEMISWWLYGAQNYKENFHYAVYDTKSIRRLLEKYFVVKEIVVEGTNMVVRGRR